MKGVSSALGLLPSSQLEEVNTIATIRTLLQSVNFRSELRSRFSPSANPIIRNRTKSSNRESRQLWVKRLDRSLRPLRPTRPKRNVRLRNRRETRRRRKGSRFSSVSYSLLRSFSSSIDETPSASRRDRPGRARTRDEIFALYCTFGEQPSPYRDFLAKILNILRDATEGLLSNAEVTPNSHSHLNPVVNLLQIYYREKGSRPVTRPQAICEKFDEFAHTMIEKLRRYEDQCRTFHENSINGLLSTLKQIGNFSFRLSQSFEVNWNRSNERRRSWLNSNWTNSSIRRRNFSTI